MIRVLVKKNTERILRIELRGHADYAEEGKDIVCAGVSACFLGALSAIENSKSVKYSYDKGQGYVEATKDINSYDSTVLDVLYRQLELIAKSYPKFVKIINERN
ncbi:MAG: ribosomal-processing cysteine protease Prp [Bacilli bacterium]